jgi:type I restriction enzyme M protein
MENSSWPEENPLITQRANVASNPTSFPRQICSSPAYFIAERDAIAALESDSSLMLEQQLDEMREEQSGEDGLLAEVVEGESEKQKITAKVPENPSQGNWQRSRLCRGVPRRCKAYAALLDQQDGRQSQRLKAVQEELEAKLDAKYSKLTEDEIKQLVVDDKWLATLADAVQGELDRVSQTLTSRIRQLAERYATPLPTLAKDLEALSARVDEHLKKMGAVWN